jgi:septal ring factor EnvC (AmiA/AmiB activator)
MRAHIKDLETDLATAEHTVSELQQANTTLTAQIDTLQIPANDLLRVRYCLTAWYTDSMPAQL